MHVVEARAEAAAFTRSGPAFAAQVDFLCRALRRAGVRESDVEDLVQDVFVVMWRRWGEYQRDRPLRPWLAGIAFHLAQRHLRLARRETSLGELERADE